jgi:hypothetical protein
MSRFIYPYKFPSKVTVENGQEIGHLQHEIVQGVIRSNSRLTLLRILEFVKEQLKE